MAASTFAISQPAAVLRSMPSFRLTMLTPAVAFHARSLMANTPVNFVITLITSYTSKTIQNARVSSSAPVLIQHPRKTWTCENRQPRHGDRATTTSETG
ncbi:hypothetical protein AUJ68_00015 [Candidatus Woesearchaeota archaeon CG1_02_57_44]|nr:MAG: hypothetical protein AUJ68_00015 [Candidatus Woesearchaeota archaeon CG1_02_57_44]